MLELLRMAQVLEVCFAIAAIKVLGLRVFGSETAAIIRIRASRAARRDPPD